MLLITSNSFGQDFVVTQSFNTRLLNNPAFTGFDDGLNRISMVHRAQYISPGTYNLNAFTADTRLCRPKKYVRLGVGFIGSREEQGDGYLKSSYMGSTIGFHLNASKNTLLSMGLSLGLLQQAVNWSKYVFPDQINPWGIDNNLISVNKNLTPSAGLIGVDLSGGILLKHQSKKYYKRSYMIGFSIYHLSKPNIGLVNDYLLPIRTNTHIGLSQEFIKSSMSITAKWIQQDRLKFQAFDANMEIIFNQSFILGLGLRENLNYYLPKNTLFIPISVGFGKPFETNSWRIVFSYDINVGGVKNPFGIFEFALVGNINTSCAKDKSPKLKCTNF